MTIESIFIALMVAASQQKVMAIYSMVPIYLGFLHQVQDCLIVTMYKYYTCIVLDLHTHITTTACRANIVMCIYVD